MSNNLLAPLDGIYAVLLLTLKFLAAQSKESICYQAAFVESGWTDRPPTFLVNMTFSAQGTISSLTRVNREIATPLVALALTQKDARGRVTTLYNVTAKLCEVRQFVNKVPMLKAIAQSSLKQGNYSFECPMRTGLYDMENMRINGKNPLLRFLYQSGATFEFQGGMYEPLPNKTLSTLTTYSFIAKIVKRRC